MNNLNNINEDEHYEDNILIDNYNMDSKNINSKYIENIPIKFRDLHLKVQKLMDTYIIDLKNNLYKDIFDKLFLNLKALYDLRFNKHIEIKNEYHSSITENEFLLESEDNLDENNIFYN